MNILDDVELDAAIEQLDKLLSHYIAHPDEDAKELDEISDAIEKYEDVTNILERDYKILPAKDVEGFLLYCPFKKKHVFRVYESENKRVFTDYELGADDIEIKIKDKFVKLYKYSEGAKIDYSLKVLGKI